MNSLLSNRFLTGMQPVWLLGRLLVTCKAGEDCKNKKPRDGGVLIYNELWKIRVVISAYEFIGSWILITCCSDQWI
jgi:hypothetical protein